MKKTRSTKQALILSALSLLLCMSMLVGTTFAWFTDSVTSANNIITAGNLDVELYYQNDETSDWTEVDASTNVFKENTLWEPGHTEVVYLKVKNAGTLALKYQLSINVASEKPGTNVDNEKFLLSDYIRYAAVLDIEEKFDNRDEALKAVENAPETYLKQAFVKKNVELEAGKEKTLALVVYMPTTVGNEANYKTGTDAPYINLGINLLAAQYTYEEDSFGPDYDKDAEYWDKTADTTWYDPEATDYEITTPHQLAGLVALVDNGETFEDKTVKLGADIDLEGKLLDPIGSYRNDKAFKGTFDGQGHTISNLSQNTWALNNGYYYGDLGLGLFGLVEDATIKNLTIDGAEISGESALCGTVAATAYGECTFENITIKNAKVADYQYYAGGIVGWASGNHVYKGCVVDETTTIGSQWGDFGNANGGLIGGIGSSAKIFFEECVVACRIDATNDVVSAYQWHNYRNSGMLIGRVPQTITNGEVQTVKTPENVTCKDVTVIYGDWANYTYCEFAGTGYPYVRVQAGTSVDAYSNVRYGHPTDANGNTVVDDNHVHNEGEDHHVLIAFDQLFGGPADHRYCYYGISEYDGVDVVYEHGGKVYNHKATTIDELKEAFKEGGTIILADDIQIDKITSIEPGTEVYLNLNGNTITVDQNTTSNTMFYVKEGGKLIIDGDGTIDLGSVSTMAIFAPYGELVIENGTFIRDEVTTVTNKTTGLFMGAKTTASNVTINGGYFDAGYYDANAADIEAILAGTATFTETADDIAKRGNSKDANAVRVALKDNVSVLLNHSGYGSFKVYGGTFVGANPAWGDEGCMLPTKPNYLRPWSYYQGALLEGQTFNENGLVIPDGYNITRTVNADGVPVYTVEYTK